MPDEHETRATVNGMPEVECEDVPTQKITVDRIEIPKELAAPG
jgi:hypothetical protein